MKFRIPQFPRHALLICALGLILITNMVILLGVAWNRSGEPDSVLTLSQRELKLRTNHTTDNSGMSFDLQWRAPPDPTDESRYWGIVGGGNMPVWLDHEKMQSLGFRNRSDEQGDAARRHRPHEQSRDVLLVLEFNADHYRRALDQARTLAESATVALGADPDNEELQRRAKTAEVNLVQETSNTSRLFVVDAGLDHATLRARYPDHHRHAIVRGQIMPWYAVPNEEGPRGYIKQVTNAQINVPHDARAQLWAVPGKIRKTAYETELAFGRRLEPWVVGVSFARD